jgi:hypothetical protein
MAIVRAIASGNWSNTAIWNTGSLPTSADDVYSNTFTVTIDTSPTVLSIRTTSATGVTAGGQFLFTNGITVTCIGAGFVQNNFNNNEILFNLAFPAVVNLVGTFSGQSLNINGTGTVNITGNVTNGNLNLPTIFFAGTGANGSTLNITGNVTGANSGIAPQPTIRLLNYGPTVNITGNVTAGLLGAGAQAISEITSANAVISIVGTVTAQDNVPAVFITSTSPLAYFSGPFICSPNGTHAVCAPKWRWTTATPSNTYYQIRNNTLAAIRPLYSADSVGGNPATSNVRSGTVYGPNSELTGTCAVPAAGSVAFGVPVDATTGTAVLTPVSLRAAVGLASANLDTQLDALPTAPENAAAVRSELSTELGRIDATVSSRLAPNGTLARVTLTDTTTALTDVSNIVTAVWAATTRTLSDVSNIVSGVWTAATRTITGGTVDTVINIDVPTGAEIASAVRTELSTELARIDVATSTRLAPDGTLARVTLTDTTTTLADPPDVPSETEIAEAVRTELATELGRIDVATSTRLAPDGTLARVTLIDTTTAVTDTAAIAEAVRTELTPELARVANASTTQEVADIVEGAAAIPGG